MACGLNDSHQKPRMTPVDRCAAWLSRARSRLRSRDARGLANDSPSSRQNMRQRVFVDAHKACVRAAVHICFNKPSFFLKPPQGCYSVNLRRTSVFLLALSNNVRSFNGSIFEFAAFSTVFTGFSLDEWEKRFKSSRAGPFDRRCHWGASRSGVKSVMRHR